MGHPRGKLNLIAVILLLAVAAFIYSIVMFSTAFIDNFEVKEQIASAYNTGTKLDDQGIRHFLEEQTAKLGEHDVDDGFGNIRKAPGLGLTDEDITIDRDEVAQTIVIRVDYTRRITLKPTSKVYELHFHPQLAGPIVIRR